MTDYVISSHVTAVKISQSEPTAPIKPLPQVSAKLPMSVERLGGDIDGQVITPLQQAVQTFNGLTPSQRQERLLDLSAFDLADFATLVNLVNLVPTSLKPEQRTELGNDALAMLADPVGTQLRFDPSRWDRQAGVLMAAIAAMNLARQTGAELLGKFAIMARDATVAQGIATVEAGRAQMYAALGGAVIGATMSVGGAVYSARGHKANYGDVKSNLDTAQKLEFTNTEIKVRIDQVSPKVGSGVTKVEGVKVEGAKLEGAKLEGAKLDNDVLTPPDQTRVDAQRNNRMDTDSGPVDVKSNAQTTKDAEVISTGDSKNTRTPAVSEESAKGAVETTDVQGQKATTQADQEAAIQKDVNHVVKDAEQQAPVTKTTTEVAEGETAAQVVEFDVEAEQLMQQERAVLELTFRENVAKIGELRTRSALNQEHIATQHTVGNTLSSGAMSISQALNATIMLERSKADQEGIKAGGDAQVNGSLVGAQTAVVDQTTAEIGKLLDALAALQQQAADRIAVISKV
jgi:hypothetical protein